MFNFVLIFNLDVTPHQDYVTHFEPSQSVGGAKMGDSREKPPDTRNQNLACLTCDPY